MRPRETTAEFYQGRIHEMGIRRAPGECRRDHGEYWAEKITELVDGRWNILDLCCGTGGLLKILPATVSYTGIDITSEFIEEAKRLHPTHEFIVGDLSDKRVIEKVPDDSYDLVIGRWALAPLSSLWGSRFDVFLAELLRVSPRVYLFSPESIQADVWERRSGTCVKVLDSK